MNRPGAKPSGSRNPFDALQAKKAHINIIGRRVSGVANDVGKSRVQQQVERRSRIVDNKTKQGRTSQFVDKRIGEKVNSISQEEKDYMRFTRERQLRAKGKKNAAFNLDSNEGLTHFGRSIDELDKAELRGQPNSEDDDDHDDFNPDAPQSYDSVITRSKEHKAERIREKERHEQELADLDKSFTAMLPNLDFRAPKSQTPAEPDDYDKLTRSLADDRKAAPATFHKSAIELAWEEKRRVEVLEAARLRREQGEEDEDEAQVDAPEEAGDAFESFIEFVIDEKMNDLQAVLPVLLEKATLAGSRVESFFSSELLDRYGEEPEADDRALNLIRLACNLFSVTDFQNRILTPALILLSHWSLKPSAGIKHLALLFSFLAPPKRYLPCFFTLANRLATDDARELTSAYVTVLPEETLALIGKVDGFTPSQTLHPLRLHAFKPMEVPALEPVFYESNRAREDPVLAERKKLKRALAMERRTTKRHLTRDAQATQVIAAQQKRKFNESQEEAAKRVRRILDQSEEEIRKLSTTNRKRFAKPKSKLPRMAGNKTEDN